MSYRNISSLFGAVLGFLFFLCIAVWRAQQPLPVRPQFSTGRIVVSAPILAAMYGGDRFLAADLEAMRLAATGTDNDRVDAHYLIRAQRVVSELNPCHEDNYYLANGLLTWGGAVDEGNAILLRAMDCRFWDGIPAYFYGVNRSFFDRDVSEAVRAFTLASERWPENATSFQRMAIMLRAEGFNDAVLALEYLKGQRDNTRDLRLRDMLEQRVIRLQGLINLRAAQQGYERKHGALTDLRQLVISGELDQLPVDPLGLGYELRSGVVELKKLNFSGMER